MLGIITGNIWKVAACTAGAACLTLTVTLGVVTVQRNNARNDVVELTASIEDPINGWRARHAAEKANRITLSTAVDQQNAAVDALRADSDRRVAAAERGWRDAQRAAAGARNRADRIAAAQIAGTTTCERIESVDAQILEALK